VTVPRNLLIRKSVERGNLISKDLHDRLSRDLRRSLNQFTPKTGEPTFIRRRGIRAGRINPKLIESLEKDITRTFENYTKKDPRYGVPANVHGIAVTELRSAVSEMKASYMNEFRAANPDTQVFKRWIHNRSLSKEPRPHHMAHNRKTAAWDEPFVLSNGAVLMYPHDPAAPAEEVINCNCDYIVYVRRR
jgi:hypothetical protein